MSATFGATGSNATPGLTSISIETLRLDRSARTGLALLPVSDCRRGSLSDSAWASYPEIVEMLDERAPRHAAGRDDLRQANFRIEISVHVFERSSDSRVARSVVRSAATFRCSCAVDGAAVRCSRILGKIAPLSASAGSNLAASLPQQQDARSVRGCDSSPPAIPTPPRIGAGSSETRQAARQVASEVESR